MQTERGSERARKIQHEGAALPFCVRGELEISVGHQFGEANDDIRQCAGENDGRDVGLSSFILDIPCSPHEAKRLGGDNPKIVSDCTSEFRPFPGNLHAQKM